MKNSELQLEHSDTTLIARYANTTEWNVRAVLTGLRGKRGSKLQDAIKKAAMLRSEQNRELNTMCQQLTINKVTPTK